MLAGSSASSIHDLTLNQEDSWTLIQSKRHRQQQNHSKMPKKSAVSMESLLDQVSLWIQSHHSSMSHSAALLTEFVGRLLQSVLGEDEATVAVLKQLIQLFDSKESAESRTLFMEAPSSVKLKSSVSVSSSVAAAVSSGSLKSASSSSSSLSPSSLSPSIPASSSIPVNNNNNTVKKTWAAIALTHATSPLRPLNNNTSSRVQSRPPLTRESLQQKLNRAEQIRLENQQKRLMRAKGQMEQRHDRLVELWRRQDGERLLAQEKLQTKLVDAQMRRVELLKDRAMLFTSSGGGGGGLGGNSSAAVIMMGEERSGSEMEPVEDGSCALMHHVVETAVVPQEQIHSESDCPSTMPSSRSVGHPVPAATPSTPKHQSNNPVNLDSSKKTIVEQKLAKAEERLNELSEVRLKKISEKAAKDEAVQERRDLLEKRRLAKLRSIEVKKKVVEVRKVQERLAAMAVKEAEKEEKARRLAELQSKKEDAVHEFKRELEMKLEKGTKRHGEHIEQVKEKAAGVAQHSREVARRNAKKSPGRLLEFMSGDEDCAGGLSAGLMNTPQNLSGRNSAQGMYAAAVLSTHESNEESLDEIELSLEKAINNTAGRKSAKSGSKKSKNRNKGMGSHNASATGAATHTVPSSKQPQHPPVTHLKSAECLSKLIAGFNLAAESNAQEVNFKELEVLFATYCAQPNARFDQFVDTKLHESLDKALNMFSQTEVFSVEAARLTVTLLSIQLLSDTANATPKVPSHALKYVKPVICLLSKAILPDCTSLASRPSFIAAGQSFELLSKSIDWERQESLEDFRTQMTQFSLNFELIQKLRSVYSVIHGPLEGELSSFITPFIKHSIFFLHVILSIPNLESSPVFLPRTDPIDNNLLTVLKETELVGIVTLLDSILLYSGKSRAAAIVEDLSQDLLLVSLISLRTLNHIACLDLKLFQSILGSHPKNAADPKSPEPRRSSNAAISLQMEYYHLLVFWFGYCTKEGRLTSLTATRTDSADTRQLLTEILNELILSLGYYTIENPKNQCLVRFGQYPTVLQQLTSLPFQYFADSNLANVLFPTLLASCHQDPDGLIILRKEISMAHLKKFLHDKIEAYKDDQYLTAASVLNPSFSHFGRAAESKDCPPSLIQPSKFSSRFELKNRVPDRVYTSMFNSLSQEVKE